MDIYYNYSIFLHIKGLLQTLKIYSGLPQDVVKCNDIELFPEKSDLSAETSLEGSGFIDFDKVAIIVVFITKHH
ncbi:hypothetical protein KQX54_014014 [Cotesia glomerata]|uniref:Uncharacterized protein n=1 Tax=Cotesia glomerata TaxID=32391 RepID=A0AAV7I9C0_COTGL|nr:hypothetical protein KQX54_014014 [Cotesia glomerata]